MEIKNAAMLFFENKQTTLESIAYQCPLTGGTAVFRARGLLSLVGDYDFGDDVVNCQSVGSRNATADGSSPSDRLKVFPNPGKGVFTVILPAHERGELLVSDLNGKLVFEQKTNGEIQRTLDLSHLSNGVYFCRFTADANVQLVIRMVLVK